MKLPISLYSIIIVHAFKIGNLGPQALVSYEFRALSGTLGPSPSSKARLEVELASSYNNIAMPFPQRSMYARS